MGGGLDDAFDGLLRTLGECTDFVRSHPFWSEPENQPSGYLFVIGMLLARLEEDVIFEPDLPYFRVLDTRIREGGDNPDQSYLNSAIRGGETYRIWGDIGTVRRLDTQVFAGDPADPASNGRADAYLSFEQLEVDPDGTFEIFISPHPHPRNWIENPPDATRVIVRQVFSDWDSEWSGAVHIDRVGHEGDTRPVLTPDDLAARLDKAAKRLASRVQVWPEMVRTSYVDRMAPNTLAPLYDPAHVGGVPGRWMSHGIFDLDHDQALVVRTWPANGDYQGIQIGDLWFSSLEYANRQTSLSADQAHLSDDGSYWFVISAHDPGVANWLDTMGHRRGVVLLRYDGTDGTPLDAALHPTAMVVPFDAVRDHLPAGTPVIDDMFRRDTLARRRRHVQLRFRI